MLSLFCVVVCVLAQLINSAVHTAAILLRKRGVVDFIDRDLPWYQIHGTFAIPQSETYKINSAVFVPAFLMSCWRVWSLIHTSNFLLLTCHILLLLRTGFAAVSRPLFNQFIGGHSVKGNDRPIALSVYDWTVPDIRRD